MTICLRCHRPLSKPTESGMGPVCTKLAQPVAMVERDLFGYDINAAALAAGVRIAVFVDQIGELAKFQIRRDFAAARRRLGVWA